MKVLVTGSTGLVGSTAVAFLEERDCEVIGVDNDMRHKFFNTPSKTPTKKLDIRNRHEVYELIAEEKPDVIIHAAAQPSHEYSKLHSYEDFEINAAGSLTLIEAAATFVPETTFIYVSTDKVYGWGMRRDDLVERETRWHHDKPFDEQTPFEPPFSPFGVSKYAADLYLQDFAVRKGIKSAAFRCGCITGRAHEGAEQHGFLAYLAKCIREDVPYKIYGYKGKQVRDQIHAYDLVNAFWSVIENPHVAQVYNMGGGPDRSVSVLEAIELIGAYTGKTAITEYVEEARFGDRQWDVHDVSHFREDYPEWDYKYSLTDIIEDICKK